MTTQTLPEPWELGAQPVPEQEIPVPVLQVLSELDRLQVRYCLLGSPATLRPSGRCQEIDLLLESDDLGLARKIFGESGFVSIPSWGHAPHHFFVTYVEQRDLWVKLDVVTGLGFGVPIRALRLDLAGSCLERRRRGGCTYLLSPEDSLLIVLLKLLLQRDTPQRQQNRVESLWKLYSLIRTSPQEMVRFRERVAEWLEPALPAGLLFESLEQRRWEPLKERRKKVFRRLFLRAPMATLWRLGWGLLLRRVRPLLFAARRRGLWIALIAPDGSGKTTLATALAREPYIRAEYVYLGLYGKVGWPEWLWGAEDFGWLGARTASLWRLVLHRARLLRAQYHLLFGRMVVFDRFYYEVRLSKSPGPFRARLQRWLLETRRRPDLTILLDAPGKLLFERKGERTPQDLEQQRQAFLRLARELPITVLDATRDIDQLRRRLVQLIWQCYGRRKNAEA